jgi:FixJ family two-component response regulator
VQLVITDVSLPTMTGPELAAQMTTEPYPPPVLFVSGDHAFLDLPGPVLKKPFSARNFREMVEWLVQPDAPAAPLSRAS